MTRELQKDGFAIGHRLRGAYSGRIGIIHWQDIVNDARMRNRATLQAAGLNRKRLTPLTSKVEDGDAKADNLD